MCENRFIEEKIFLFIIFHQISMKKPKGVRLLTTVRHLTFLPKRIISTFVVSKFRNPFSLLLPLVVSSSTAEEPETRSVEQVG